MKSVYKYAMLALLIILLVGCATIFKGTSANVRLNSSPSGATVLINNIDHGKTPVTLSLARNKDYTVTFKMDGYKDVNMEINKQFDILTTVVGNIFSWSLIGIIVDVADGAAYTLKPADLTAYMKKLQEAGYVPTHFNKKSNTLTVLMLTQAQWNQIKSNQ